jgi:hypothetical protein
LRSWTKTTLFTANVDANTKWRGATKAEEDDLTRVLDECLTVRYNGQLDAPSEEPKERMLQFSHRHMLLQWQPSRVRFRLRMCHDKIMTKLKWMSAVLCSHTTKLRCMLRS